MLGIYIIITVLILLASIFIISDYIEQTEETFNYQQKMISQLVKENTEYRKIIGKKNNADRTYWG